MAMWRQRAERAVWLSVCTVCVLLLTVSPLVSATIDYDNPTVAGDAYLYPWFTSSTETNVLPREGESGVGIFCRPGVSMSYDVTRDRVVFSDMCQTTSTIRELNQSGYLGVLAGSLTAGAGTGFVDGTKDQARFQGISTGTSVGTSLMNGIVYQGGYYYLADTGNNAIRRIDNAGDTITFINTQNGVNGESLNNPTYLANYAQTTGYLISDTGGSRILQVTPPVQTLLSLVTGLPTQPRVLASTSKATYFVGNGLGIYRVTNASQGAAQLLSDLNCLTYFNSLVVNEDAQVIYFLASTDDESTINVYNVSIADGADPTACPTPVFQWPFADSLFSITQRVDNTWVLMTSSGVYAGGLAPLTPIDTSTTTTTTTLTPTDTPGTTTTTLPPIFSGRTHGVAAFPTDALPTEDPCLMSQLYYWMRQDAEIAYSTNDYYTQFVPITDTSMAFLGSVNVSALCGEVKARESNDGSIEIVDFWGPTGYDRWYTQGQLTDSPWYWTRRFLDSLHRDDLGPFCFYNCTDTCVTSTANPKMCVDYQSCDDICKGAIASSVVMGVTGIVLIILMIVSPANLFTALVMVPII